MEKLIHWSEKFYFCSWFSIVWQIPVQLEFFLSMEILQKIIKQWFSTCPEIMSSFLVSRGHILCASANIQGFVSRACI